MNHVSGGEVAAIGALPLMGGFALTGVRVFPADSAEDVRTSWRLLPEEVKVVILTAEAAAALGDAAQTRLTVVLPP